MIELSRAIINKPNFWYHKLYMHVYHCWSVTFKWWLLKEPFCLWKLHTIQFLVVFFAVTLELILLVTISYFRHFIVVVFWSIKCIWHPARFQRSSQPSDALKSASLHNSVAFSRRINLLMTTSEKKIKRSKIWINCLTTSDNMRNWLIRSGHSHGLCKHCNSSDRNELLKVFHCFRKTKDLPWLLCSENQFSIAVQFRILGRVTAHCLLFCWHIKLTFEEVNLTYSPATKHHLSASATTFSLKAKLYEEQQAFGMIEYDNFEREGLFETGS